eukprot:scaffold41611_cov18-Tisochrysis_lutea.AAC.1
MRLQCLAPCPAASARAADGAAGAAALQGRRSGCGAHPPHELLATPHWARCHAPGLSLSDTHSTVHFPSRCPSWDQGPSGSQSRGALEPAAVEFAGIELYELSCPELTPCPRRGVALNVVLNHVSCALGLLEENACNLAQQRSLSPNKAVWGQVNTFELAAETVGSVAGLWVLGVKKVCKTLHLPVITTVPQEGCCSAPGGEEVPVQVLDCHLSHHTLTSRHLSGWHSPVCDDFAHRTNKGAVVQVDFLAKCTQPHVKRKFCTIQNIPCSAANSRAKLQSGCSILRNCVQSKPHGDKKRKCV